MKDMQRLTIVILAMLASCARELPPAAEFEAADAVVVDTDVWAGELGAADTFGEAEVDAAEGSDVADVPDAPDVAETADAPDTADVAETTDVPDAVTPDVEPDVLDVVQTCPAPCTAPDPCQTASCNPKTGNCETAPKADGAGCDDGQACTQGSTCQAGQCQGGAVAPPCGCTADSDCAAQDDGKLCNGSFYCDKSAPIWACKLNPGSVVSCQDPGEPCKSALCLEPGSPGNDGSTAKCAIALMEDGTPCDDAKAWTVGDSCAGGHCVASADVKLCKDTTECAAYEDGDLCNGTLFCNKALGVCQVLPKSVVSCPTAADTTCQTMQCQKATGKCQVIAKPDQVACDDGLLCTTGEACMSGICTATVGAKTCQCAADSDCGKYEDGDACNGKLFCNLAKGACEVNPASVVVCQTGLDTACSKNVCDKLTGGCGIATAPTATACDADGSPCTPYDHCEAGKCVADTSICQCAGDSDCAGWEDGDLCNGTLYCEKKSGTCAVNPATVKSCPSAGDSACSKNVCVALSGVCAMTPVGEGGGCDDGSVCTAGDACKEGKCSPGGTLKCDDGNGCTSDSCDKTQGCVYLANSLGCSDGDACTEGDKCAATVCSPGLSKACDDGNGCTSDSCDKTQGCVYLANSLTCTDGDACTVGDACKASACSPGGTLKCDDGNGCTSDSCDAAKGCSAKAMADGTNCGTNLVCQTGVCSPTCIAGQPCDDKDACTSADKCAAGACTGTAVVCSDANPCTADSCDKTKGCVALPNSATCTDGSACTVGDVCAAGSCKPGAAAQCDDSNACTADSCDAKSGCGNAVKDCNDGNSCTVDSCDKAKGCQNLAGQDGVGCGGSATCKAGICTGSGTCTEADLWSKSFGGTQTYDSASAIAESGDGGYVVAGSVGDKGAGEDDFWLIRLDGAGKLLWDAAIGTKASDFAEDVTRTVDGGFVAVGRTGGGGLGGLDGYAAKVGSDGKVAWTKVFGGAGHDALHGVTALPDGSVLLVGASAPTLGGTSDGWLLKLSPLGAVVWEHKLGGAAADELFAVAVLADGGLLAAGKTASSGAGLTDGWVVRRKADGAALWDYPIGGANDDKFSGLVGFWDGSAVLVGATQSSGAGAEDGWAVKLDAGGGKHWERTYGTAQGDMLAKVVAIGTEHVVAAGHSVSAIGVPAKTWVVTVDGSGVSQWQRIYSSSGTEFVGGIVLEANGNIGLASTADSQGGDASEVKIRRLDAFGNPSCSASGECLVLGWAGCADSDPCTADLCAGNSGCYYTNSTGTACDDDNACTIGNTCDLGACGPGQSGLLVGMPVSSFGVSALWPWNMIPESDGGFSLIQDLKFVRVDKLGNTIISKKLVGIGQLYQTCSVGNGVVLRVLVGEKAGTQQLVVVSLDKFGGQIWESPLGSSANNPLIRCSVNPSGQTAIILVSASAWSLRRLDSDGKLMSSALTAPQGTNGFMIAADTSRTFSAGAKGPVYALDQNGTVEWQVSAADLWGPEVSVYNAIHEILPSSQDGSLYVIGAKNPEGVKYAVPHAWAARLNSGGKLLWSVMVPVDKGNGGYFKGGQVIADGGLLAIGSSPLFTGTFRLSHTGQVTYSSFGKGLSGIGLASAKPTLSNGTLVIWQNNSNIRLIDAWGNSGCSSSNCANFPAVACDDTNPCTIDYCEPGSGCVHSPTGLVCNDDGVLCTNDVCANGTCTHPFNSAPCTDNNPCTTPDTCTNGACKGAASPAPTCALNPIPSKTATQGCDTLQTCAADESPAHPVTLPAYNLDQNEVSNVQYAACVTANKCTSPQTGGSCLYGKIGKETNPVTCLTWQQAADYCKWAYTDGRLPTEAEYERAARSTDDRYYPWGNAEPDCSYAGFNPGPSCGSVKPVGSFPAGKSADGLYDLAGNVREWTADWYAADYYKTAPALNPTGPTAGTDRVIRGGGYLSSAASLRATARDHATPDTTAPDLGFRCARSGN